MDGTVPEQGRNLAAKRDSRAETYSEVDVDWASLPERDGTGAVGNGSLAESDGALDEPVGSLGECVDAPGDRGGSLDDWKGTLEGCQSAPVDREGTALDWCTDLGDLGGTICSKKSSRSS